jgi:hypothetical protein
MNVFLITTMTNKWRAKNEQKLIKLYDTKPNYPNNPKPSGQPQNGK